MSNVVQQVLSQIDRLSLTEQVQVLTHLAQQIDRSVSGKSVQPKYQVTDFDGKANNLLAGVDAQEWVNRVRDEWEEREAWINK